MRANPKARAPWLAFACMAAITIAACGTRLIADPSFDLWCGNALCSPWEVNGSVRKVKTWHERDFAVSLADGTVLSQRAQRRADCIEFEVIADVSAEADVVLEMDFRDDGTSEWSQQIPESRWVALRFIVHAPAWYDELRFILHKRGRGRAVLAQIKASGTSCDTPRVVLNERPLGAVCASGDQCDSGVCGKLPEGERPDDLELQLAAMRCSQCSVDAPCAGGQRCAVARAEAGLHASCVAPNSQPTGSVCVDDSACASDLCLPGSEQTRPACGECESDLDCGQDSLCGLVAGDHGAGRSCQPPSSDPVGEHCLSEAECASGVCCGGLCSECCDEQRCQGGSRCSGSESGLSAARLCGRQRGDRQPGDACLADEDCFTAGCELPEPRCDACLGEACAVSAAHSCLQPWQPVGSCR